MDRRAFFAATGATAGAAAIATLPSVGFAQAPSRAAPAAANPVLSAFNPRFTPLQGYAGQDVACDALAIEGRIPAGLRGVFYRNGPGLFERGGERYQHWFDGDGLVHAYRFTDSGVSHRARFVATKKFLAESRENRFLVPAFGTAIKPRIPVRGPDDVNTANTSVLPHAGKLYALWEGGSAYQLDAQSLATVGPVTWAPALKSMPFSAHPKVEADGTWWNFGALGGKLALYQIAPNGELKRSEVLTLPGGVPMVHDFAVAQRHLVFVLPPVRFDRAGSAAGKSIAESMSWQPDQPTRILVVEKADFTRYRVIEMPAFNFFHIGNAWEDGGTIRVDLVASDDLGIMNDWMPAMMRGERRAPQASNAALVVVDTVNGTARLERQPEICEFPRIDPRFVAQRNRLVYYPASLGVARDYPYFNGVLRIDYDSGQRETCVLQGEIELEEHILVPKPAARREGEAWLIGAGFDARRQQSFVTVFDAERLSDGPLAMARLPYWVPHCFHGNFAAA